jgi:hypothetical protein
VLNAVKNNCPFVFDHADQRHLFAETYSSVAAWEEEHGVPEANPTGAVLLAAD